MLLGKVQVLRPFQFGSTVSFGPLQLELLVPWVVVSMSSQRAYIPVDMTNDQPQQQAFF